MSLGEGQGTGRNGDRDPSAGILQSPLWWLQAMPSGLVFRGNTGQTEHFRANAARNVPSVPAR